MLKWAEAQVKFKDDEESLEKVEDYLLSGNIQRAKTKVEKAKVEVKPVETEADMKARLLKELQAEDRKTETGMPAGGNSSDEDFVKKFASGELPATKANADRYEKIRDSY